MKFLLDLYWPMDARHGPLGKMMKPKWFIRYTAGCTKWDHKQNGKIMEELNTESMLQNTGKHRTGEIMSTVWTDRELPNKFCSTCLKAKDLWSVWPKKNGPRP